MEIYPTQGPVFEVIPDNRGNLQRYFQDYLHSQRERISDVTVEELLDFAKADPEMSLNLLLGSDYVNEVANRELTYVNPTQFILEFLESYLEFHRWCIPDVTVDEVFVAVTNQLNEASIPVPEDSSWKEFAELKLLKAQVCANEIRDDAFDVSILTNRETLLNTFRVTHIHSVLCSLSLEDKVKIDYFFERRAELETYRFLMGDPCAHQAFLDPLRKKYLVWITEKINLLFPKVYGHYECRLEEINEKTRNFSMSDLSEKKQIVYVPRFSVYFFQKKRHANCIATATLQLTVMGSMTNTKKDHRYTFIVTLLDIQDVPDVKSSRMKRFLKRLLEDLNCRNRSLCEPPKKQKLQDVSALKLSDLKERAPTKEKRKRKIRSPRIRGLRSPRKNKFGSGIVLLRKNSEERSSYSERDLKKHWPKSKSNPPSGTRITYVNSAKFSRRRRSKTTKVVEKTCDDLAKEIERLIPTMIGNIYANLIQLLETPLKYLKGYRELLSDNEQKFSKEVLKYLEYASYSQAIRNLQKNFGYLDTKNQELKKVSSLSVPKLLNHATFVAVIQSPNTCRRLLGRGHHFIPSSEKFRRLLEGGFANIYRAGYTDFYSYNSSSKNEIEWVSELQARRALCGKFDPIQKFLYPSLLGPEWLQATYSIFFPHLNQVEMSETSFSDSSEEVVAVGIYPIKSELSSRFRKLLIECKSQEYAIYRHYRFNLSLHHQPNPFAHIDLSDVIVEHKEKWFRKMRINDITFCKGTSLELVKHVICRMSQSAKSRNCCK